MTPPRFWYDTTARVPLALRLLSVVYGWARAIHVGLTRPSPAPVPTICIGNVTVGGAGKTPVVRALRAALAPYAPVVLTRGYGGVIPGPVFVTNSHTHADVGDEALLHHRDGPVIVARNRLSGARLAAKYGARLILMDDGLQNRQITATLNLLVVDGSVGWGNGALLPAGPLREPLEPALARTHAVLIIGADQTSVASSLPPGIPVFTAQSTYDTSGLDPSKPYIAFAALARPQKFYTALRSCGIKIVQTIDFPDHHAYTVQDLETLFETARAKNAFLVTTEKDHVKIPSCLKNKVAVLPLHLRFEAVDRLKSFLETHALGTPSCP